MIDERLARDPFLTEQRRIIYDVNHFKTQLEIAIEENIFSISHVNICIVSNDDFDWRSELLDQFTIEELGIFFMIADVDIEKLTDFVRYLNCSKLSLHLRQGGSLNISIEELLSLPVKALKFFDVETFKDVGSPSRPSHFLVELELEMVVSENVQTQLFENIPYIESLSLNVETLNVPEGVCSRLKSLSVFDKSMSANISFHRSLLKSLSHLSTIETLFVSICDLDYNGEFNDMMFVIALLPRLSKLSLAAGWLAPTLEEDRPSVNKILPLSSKLNDISLCLCHCAEPDNQLESTVNWLSQLPCLRRLTLNLTQPNEFNRQLRALPIGGMFPSIENAYFLSGTGVLFEHALNCMLQSTTLSELCLFEDNNIDLSRGITAPLRQLKFIGTFRTPITSILTSLAHSSKLNGLQIGSPDIDAIENNAVATAIQRFENLELLSVNFPTETNGRCEQIVKHCLRHSFRLRKVFLETASDSVDTSIAARLIYIPQLTHLRLISGIFTSQQDRMRFINALNVHPSLVDITWTGASENERTRLRNITCRNKCNVVRRYRSLLDRLLEINDSFLQRKRESRACSSSPQ